MQADQYNALRDQADYLQNTAGGNGPQPWQASYVNPNPGGLDPSQQTAFRMSNPGAWAESQYAQGAQGFMGQAPSMGNRGATGMAMSGGGNVPVSLGGGVRENAMVNPSTLATLIRSGTPNQQPSYGLFGDDLYVNGAHSGNISQYAAQSGQTVDQYLPGQVARMQAAYPQAAASPAPSDPRGLMSWLQARPELAGASGPQLDAYFQQIKGTDYNTALQQDRQNMEAGIKMQQDQSGLQKSQFDAFTQATQSLGAKTPQEFATTYNSDPAHKNQFLSQGEWVPDPLNLGKFIQKPSQWITVQPEAGDYAMSLAPKGYTQGLSSTQNIANQQAEFAQLHQQRNDALSGQHGSSDMSLQPISDQDYQPYATPPGGMTSTAQTASPDTAGAALAQRNRFLNFLQNGGSRIAQMGNQAGSALVNILQYPIAQPVNTLAGYAGSSQNVIPSATQSNWQQSFPVQLARMLFPFPTGQ